MSRIPYVPLISALFVQTLATMAAFSVAAAAPSISKELQVPGEYVGLFISAVYGCGMVSAMFSPSFIHRYGAVRVSQVIMVATIAMVLMASLGSSLGTLAFSAVLLGCGYGATAPTSSHLLMKRTPADIRNLVFSVRQIGVPLGGVLGGLLVPPLVLAYSWQTALFIQIVPAAVMLLLLQWMRPEYDADRDPAHAIGAKGLLGPLMLLKTMPELRVLTAAVFFYGGTQLCFVAYTSVHLTSQAGFGLVAAGQMLATYQISGVVSRPIWGVVADRWIPARTMLIIMGFVMAAMAFLAGTFSPDWPWIGIFLVCIGAGATASGYTGLAFAEYARMGGAERAAETTGLGAASQFFGVMMLPSSFSFVVAAGGYDLAYEVIAALAALSGGALWLFGGNRQR
ncbi:MAG: MFS transporter [Alphaproteobacteria bacterium]|nr:MFS transporter [Alphaproteobacteria bacterium]MCB9929948.1 MFS transporter [Alphaproteobacteria bacterium]